MAKRSTAAPTMIHYTIEDLYRMQKHLIARQDAGTLAQGAPVITAPPSQIRRVKNKKKTKASVDNCKLSDMEDVQQPHKPQSMKSKKRAEKRRAERVSQNIGKELLEKYPIDTFDFGGQKTDASRSASPEPTQDTFNFVVPSETFTFATGINDGNFAKTIPQERFVGFLPVSESVHQLSSDDREFPHPQTTSFTHRKIAVPKSRRRAFSSIPAEIDAEITQEQSALDNGIQAPAEDAADEQNALDLELGTIIQSAERDERADSVQDTITDTTSSDSSCGELTLYDVSRQGSPETSATVVSSAAEDTGNASEFTLEKKESARPRGGASFEVLMQASHLQIGTVAYTDFIETLMDIGYEHFTKEDIAATFLKLSNEEREDLGLEPHNLPGTPEGILRSMMLLKKIKIGNIKLHDFLNMVKFS